MQFIFKFLFLSAALPLCLVSAHAQETVIRLGQVAAMSGAMARFGRDNANGAIRSCARKRVA